MLVKSWKERTGGRLEKVLKEIMATRLWAWLKQFSRVPAQQAPGSKLKPSSTKGEREERGRGRDRGRKRERERERERGRQN
jgi:hypothetical protein